MSCIQQTLSHRFAKAEDERMDGTKDALHRAAAHAIAYLEQLDARPAAATATADGLRHALSFELPRSGVSAARVIDDLVAATAGGHPGSAGGRFFAWAIGGALPSALAADWLAAAWDVNACLYACGPAAAIVEEIAGAWVKDVLDLPRNASFAFTTGCQMAHVTCLAAARHAVLARHGWNVEAKGLFGAPPIRVLATAERHGSIDRALRFLGLGTDALHPLAVDADGRVPTAALSEALAVTGAPTILVLGAGDLNIGAFDPFATLVPMARQADAWVHVDGAFGLWARASGAHAHLAAGVELADSWATDAHKWLNTPQDNGIALVRDAAAHRAAMTLSAAYLTAGGGARDAMDWTPDWTRRARGYAFYAALRELGRDGLADLVDHCCVFARELTLGIAGLPGCELVAAPTLNQGLVRFIDPHGTDDNDRFTDAVTTAINADGVAFFSGTLWRGRRAMRISVLNWRTCADDVRQTIEAVGRVLKRCAERRCDDPQNDGWVQHDDAASRERAGRFTDA